jgi:hypothetical protein
LGWRDADRPARLRLIADAYGIDATGRRQLLDRLSTSIPRSGEFVRRRVEAGDPNFVAMWNGFGGRERFDRRFQWWSDNRHRFAAALGL